jgi:hypothetical protein
MGLEFPLKITTTCLFRQVSFLGNAPGITTLTSTVADQAALCGILTRIWDLNLTVVSVTRGGVQ